MNIEERRVLIAERSAGYIARRPLPIGHLQVTATTSGAAQTLLTVNTNVLFKINRLTVVNITGTAATLTLHSIPNGGSLGNDNIELAGYSVAANTAVDITELVGGMYQAAAVLKCFSGTNGSLVVHGHGEEIF